MRSSIVSRLRALLYLGLWVPLMSCGGGGGGSSPPAASPPPPPPAQGSPTPVIDSPPTTQSYLTVNLDGSLSTDSASTLSSYQWTQTAGPAVTLSNADSSQASFIAPQVSAAATLTFALKVTDALGTAATQSASLTVNPATQVTPAFVDVEVLRPVDNNPHLNAVPVQETLLSGSTAVLQVSFTGAPQLPTLTLTDASGVSLGTVTGVTAIGDPSQQPLTFTGTFTVPQVPFQIVASGKSGDGQPFSVANPAPAGASSNLITPQSVGVSFNLTHVRLSSASPTATVQATITNGTSSAVTLTPLLTDPAQVDPTQDAQGAIPAVTVPANGTSSLSFTLRYPPSPAAVVSSFSLTLLNLANPTQVAGSNLTVLMDDAP